MTGLLVLVPTRTRPRSVQLLAQVFAKTCTADTGLVFCVDGCPQIDDYRAEVDAARMIYSRTTLLQSSRRRLVGTLNYHATMVAAVEHSPFAIGFMGDDHCPISTGWDTQYLDALTDLGSGIVYGDDELQGANLPTQLAMTTDIVRALGYMAPPCLTHMYCDNFWKDLGEQAGCLTFLKDVVVTHRHPSVTHAPWDDSYLESNSPEQYTQDKMAYEQFARTKLALDVAKVIALRTME